MIYKINEFTENGINPITNTKYDESWLILTLSNDISEPMIVGSNNYSAYTIKINKQLHSNWKMSVGDFTQYCNSSNLNGIIVISENDYEKAKNYYTGHSFDETVLRKNNCIPDIDATGNCQPDRTGRACFKGADGGVCKPWF